MEEMQFDEEFILKYMNEALSECNEALNQGEVPVGCVFLHLPSMKIIARSHNLTNKTKNATTHCEINCINYVYSILNDKSENGLLKKEEFLKKYNIPDENAIFSNCVLFVSCEPCIMCAYALNLVSIMYYLIKFIFSIYQIFRD
jgi:tRNA-specific adenosine deaminase 2